MDTATGEGAASIRSVSRGTVGKVLSGTMSIHWAWKTNSPHWRFRFPHHDLGLIGRVVLVDEGDAHPEAGEHLEHYSERSEIELYIITVDDRAPVHVAFDVTTKHLPAWHPLAASLAVSDLRAARPQVGRRPTGE